jgi:hypothetical protein
LRAGGGSAIISRRLLLGAHARPINSNADEFFCDLAAF